MKKLNWGLIGGGEGSQIGPAHRIAANIDGQFTLCAGALDIDETKAREFAEQLSIVPSRAYGNWQKMLTAEESHSDPLDLITVATPNSTHYEIAKAFLQAGFNVLIEKPMTMNVEEAEEIDQLATKKNAICAVNYGYSGYPLVREMRAMVSDGQLGNIRLIKTEFAHGFHADADKTENPRIRWRYDPSFAGPSAAFADTGIHALHLACFITNQNATSISADFASLVDGRDLEDDAMLNIRMNGGTLCRLWASAVAIGRMHGLTIQVFGELGGLNWTQEQPNQLYYTSLTGNTQIIERASDSLHLDAQRASRVTIGHTEGMLVAFANIYNDLAENIRARKENRQPKLEATLYPTTADGLHSIRAIQAAKDSAVAGSKWIDI